MLHKPWANQPELHSKIPNFCPKSNLQASKLTSLVQRLSISLKTERKESNWQGGRTGLLDLMRKAHTELQCCLWRCNFVLFVVGEY